MRGIKSIGEKRLGEMAMNKGGGIINWFPGHMAAASRAIRLRLKLSDLVLDVRDARIPLSSRNENVEELLCGKRRVIALNKMDLANPNILPKWVRYFESTNQDCLAINAHSKTCVNKLLHLVEMKLKEMISKQPTLLVMVVGVPNVGKSALINSIHRISSTSFPAQEKTKRATVGPLPGLTQDIAGFKIAHQPSIYVLDTPGVLVPSIQDIETGLKLAAAGSVKDSVVGEERIARYVLAVLNTRGTTLHWKHLTDRMDRIQNASDYSAKDFLSGRRKLPNNPDVYYVEDLVSGVQRALSEPLVNFGGNIDDENDMENLIEQQFEALQRAFKVPPNASEGRTKVSKRFLTLFRAGKLGPFILDDVPEF